MSRRAVVHIGINKTGTTTIQRTLWKARNDLRRNARVLYPSLAVNHSLYLSTMFRDRAPLMLQMIEPTASDEGSVARLRADYTASFEADLRRPDWDTVVLSGESLCDLPAPAVARMLEWLSHHVDDIRVVAFVRHPVEWTRSVIQQRLKSGDTFDDAWTSPSRPRWRSRFTPWVDALGVPSFRLVSFDEVRADPGILASFWSAADLPEHAVRTLTPGEPANESMSREAALLLDSLNRQKPLYIDGQISPERRRYGAHYGIDVLRNLPGNRFVLSPEQEQKARVDNRADVEWLNSTFGTEHYLDVFDEVRPDPDSRRDSLPQVTVDALALMVADFLRERST